MHNLGGPHIVKKKTGTFEVSDDAASSGDKLRLLPGVARLLDSACVLASGYATYFALVFYSYRTAEIYQAAILIIWLLIISMFSIGGLYGLPSIVSVGRVIGKLLIGIVTAFLLMLAAAFSIKISEEVSRLWVFVFFATSVFSVFAVRGALSYALSLMENRQILAQTISYFGDNSYVQKLRPYVENSESRFLVIRSCVTDNFIRPDQSIDRDLLEKQLTGFVRQLRVTPVDDVIIALPWSATDEISKVIDALRELPVNVHLGTDLAGLSLPLRPPQDALQGAPIHEVIGRPLSGWDLVWKSMQDYIIGAMLIIILAPFLLIIALLIRIDSPGPAIFKQKRYGFNNKIFEIYKFRTMRIAEVPDGKTVQAVPDDARVTKLGKFLRRTSIDELPQLFNVMNGSMSLVGPRPHAVDHNEEYAKIIRGYFARHRVKPGITGLAQVKGFRGLTDTLDKMQNRVKYDIIYTENSSLLLDLRILAKTAFVGFGGKNAF
jgi:putative colanic acid biosysnthesis UDP-glucose lipid carrier transferase